MSINHKPASKKADRSSISSFSYSYSVAVLGVRKGGIQPETLSGACSLSVKGVICHLNIIFICWCDALKRIVDRGVAYTASSLLHAMQSLIDEAIYFLVSYEV